MFVTQTRRKKRIRAHTSSASTMSYLCVCLEQLGLTPSQVLERAAATTVCTPSGCYADMQDAFGVAQSTAPTASATLAKAPFLIALALALAARLHGAPSKR